MNDTTYLSELFRIVEGALHLDKDKVQNYAEFLAQKLETAGETSSAHRLRRIIIGQTSQLRPTSINHKVTMPVDGESRFPLLQQTNVADSITQFVFDQSHRQTIDEFLQAVRNREQLLNEGVEASTNLLLYGPPGCGKSHLAAYIAHELHLPLFVARLDGLISSFLGSTAKNIRSVIEYASKMPCVLLLDEFDAIAKFRDDHQELGELKRVVNSFIQNLDNLGREVVLIAATNHHQLLDPAVWRRFQFLLLLDYPSIDQRRNLWRLYAGSVKWSEKQILALADLSHGFSCAAIQAVSMRLRRMMITNGLVADLRRAIRLLAEFARGSFPEGNPLSLAILDDPKLMAQSLRQRDQNLYTFEVIGELADCSKATISRIMAEPEACKRKNTSGGNPNARRKTLHKSNPSKASQ